MCLVEFTLGGNPDQQIYVNPHVVSSIISAKLAAPDWEPPPEADERDEYGNKIQYAYISLQEGNFCIVKCSPREAAFAVNEALNK